MDRGLQKGPMVTDAQVRRLRRKLMEGKTLASAAAAAAMSERTARTWKEGLLPGQTKEARDWRTRPDPFSEVWETDVVPLLEADETGRLEAKTIVEVLGQRYPGRYGEAQLRTMQRRMRQWRALQGPPKTVYFQQQAQPGREGAFDFTHGTELGVTILGQPFRHLLFQFVLVYSGWRWVGLAFGETFEALVGGLQGALWELGGVPPVLRHDNLSAATHELARAAAGRSTAGSPRCSTTTGRSPRAFSRRIARKWGRREGPRPAQVRDRAGAHRARQQRLHQPGAVPRLRARAGRPALQCEGRRRAGRGAAAPGPTPVIAHPKLQHVLHARFAGGARSGAWPDLLGALAPDRPPGGGATASRRRRGLFAGRVIERMPRVREEGGHRIDYRHIIWSLVRKPGAFARYRYREDCSPR